MIRITISKTFYTLLGLILTASALAQQTDTTAQDIVELDRIIAIVNDDILMESELVSRINKVSKELREKNIPPPPLHILEKQVLDRLILQRLQIQEAIFSGVVIEDQALNLTLQKIADDSGLTLSQFRRVLERDGISFSQFREDIRNEIMISRVRSKKVANRVKVSDQEIDHLIETLEHSGELDTQYHIAHILIAIPEGASPTTAESLHAKAERIVQDIKNGKDFRQAAAASSDAQTALDGGDLGWRKRSELPSVFANIVPKMTVGDISGVIKASGGLHIVKLLNTRGEKQMFVNETKVRHILVKPSEVLTDEDARSRVEHLRNRIASGEDFDLLAKSNSDDTASALAGGDLGWVSPGKMVPEFEEVMNGTNIGDTSAPFKTQFGWHILQVENRRKHDSTQEFRRRKARGIIRKRKIEEELELWLRRLRDEAYIELRLDQA